MGKKGVCCIPLKKAPSHESREKKDKKTDKSKGWFWKTRSEESPNSSQGKTAVVSPAPPSPLPEVVDAEAVARARAVAAEAAAAAAEAAAEVVRLTAAARSPAKSKEEIAAIKIQTAFRGHKARRALRSLKAVVRLKTLIQGQSVKHQATTTLQCMQTLARVQAQIRERRLRMSEDNQALHRHLQQKHERELAKLRASVGEEWDDTTQSKEQIEANLQSKQEAAVRRERALAYAYSHQQTWRTTPRAASHATIMDPNNPHWGWSWLERWMAARPWESQSVILDKELSSQPNSAKSTTSNAHSPHHFSVVSKPSTPARKQSRLSVSSPRTKTPAGTPTGRVARRSSPRRSVCSVDDDARSVQSDRCRRHSVTGSSVRDDESVVSSSASPSYIASTRSAKAKSRLSMSKTPEKEPVGTAKKRLSFPGSPSGQRRLSGPPKMETSSVTNAGLISQGSN